MNCTRPIYAIDYGINPETGKKKVKLLPKRSDLYNRMALESRYFNAKIIPLPCGKCLNCKINYSSDWATRCQLEARLYKYNYFVTLTLDDNNLTPYVSKKVVSSFMKSLRKVYGSGVRFFACGEHGERSGRSHYHVILFNCDITDLKFFYKKDGLFYFRSKSIEDIWSKGNVTICEVTPANINYVTRYVIKKFNTHYDDEFVLMSNRPGIGSNYCLDNLYEIYDTDKIYLNGKTKKVPRYFDKLLEKVHPLLFMDVKDKREKDVTLSRAATLATYGVEYDEQALAIQDDASLLRFHHKKGGL